MMIYSSLEQFENDNREKIIYDLRKDNEFEKETYPGAVHYFWEDMVKDIEENNFSKIPKEKEIYLICYTGKKSD